MSGLARRFYKAVSATPDNGVALDQRTLRTPGGAVFRAPTQALAQAVAAEWAAQDEHILPCSMVLTQFSFAALDWTPNSRDQLVRYVTAYAETDLIAHRAEGPPPLVARQAAAWDPLVAWAAKEHELTLPVVTGVIAAQADGASLARLRALVADLDDFRLTALAQAAGLSGSAVIALALLAQRLDASEAYQAAALDNLWSLERWGEDEEARAKLDRQRAEFASLAAFIRHLSA